MCVTLVSVYCMLTFGNVRHSSLVVSLSCFPIAVAQQEDRQAKGIKYQNHVFSIFFRSVSAFVNEYVSSSFLPVSYLFSLTKITLTSVGGCCLPMWWSYQRQVSTAVKTLTVNETEHTLRSWLLITVKVSSTSSPPHLCTPVDAASKWRDAWHSTSVANKYLISDPTVRLPGFNLSRSAWST